VLHVAYLAVSRMSLRGWLSSSTFRSLLRLCPTTTRPVSISDTWRHSMAQHSTARQAQHHHRTPDRSWIEA
jgi:hypothetical protein